MQEIPFKLKLFKYNSFFCLKKITKSNFIIKMKKIIFLLKDKLINFTNFLTLINK